MILFRVKYYQFGWFLTFILPKWVGGITIAPFGIYLRDMNASNCVKTHEYIHWEQQKELLFIFFYIIYFIEWVIKLFVYGRNSYYNLSFEREARSGEKNYLYPLIRSKFCWFKYIIK